MGYQASRGLPVIFQISYRQRGSLELEDEVFGTGRNWSCSFRSFVAVVTNDQNEVQIAMHTGGAGILGYSGLAGKPQFWMGDWMTMPDGMTCHLNKRDGGREVYNVAFTNSAGKRLLFISERRDPVGNTLTFNYSFPNDGAAILLTSIVDADGRSTSISYASGAYYSNRIDHVTDPYGRTCYLDYDEFGTLTNVTDVQNLASSFSYGDDGISSMTTPYGTTSFECGGLALADPSYLFAEYAGANRYVRITQPDGGHQLYVYRQDCSAIVTNSYSPVPTTSPLTNKFDNGNQARANSFYWSPLQYVLLSTTTVDSLVASDYAMARQRHWLIDGLAADSLGASVAVNALSNERAPTQNGTNAGQVTWYDYAGKPAATNIGSSAMPLFVARVLPNGETAFEYTARNQSGNITTNIQTYTTPGGSVGLRTNRFTYAANYVDMTLLLGPNGEQVSSNVFNTYHQVTNSYDALNQETRYTYNANGQLTSVTRPGGLTTTNFYFTSGSGAYWLDKTIDLEISRTNSYTYANGLVYSHTDERGLTTTNYWDNLQRLSGVKYPDGTTLSNIYTALDLTATKDRLGYWSYAGYDSMRRKVAETNANGVVSRYGYCDCGALMTVSNAWNTTVQLVTSFNYDYQGNRTYVYLPDATVTNWYDSLGRQTIVGDAWGYRYFYYNNQGLIRDISSIYGSEQTSVFDIEDRVISVTDANGVTVTNSYDDLGRLRTRGYPDGGVERFGYSARGLIAYTNQLDKTTYYAYDEAARKVAETNANNEIIRYTNNPAGDLLSLTDGKNQTTKWNYDTYGRVTNKLDQAAAEVLRYTYDANSRLSNRWSLAKGTTIYSYDSVGNLTNVNYPASTDVRFTYDALNRASNMVDAVGTTIFAYAAGGQLWKEDGPWSSDTVTNSYTSRLRTGLSLAQPSGVWTNGFGYDPAKRLTNVTFQAGSFAYTLGGAGAASPLPKKILLPNTSYITNTYDAVARLLGTWLKKSDNTTLDSATYAYNVGNQRTTFTNRSGVWETYVYDDIGQLKIADNSVASQDRGYTYDSAWNLNYRTNNTTTYSFVVDNKNQLTNAFSAAYSHDGNGNLTNGNGGKNFYVYDDENQLVQWYNYPTGTPGTDGDRATEFVYDGLGRLRERREYYWENIEAPIGDYWVLTNTTRYIYDGRRVIQERNASGTPQVSYTRGTDLSGSLEGAGGIGGLLGRTDSSGSTFYHADGRGNITYLVTSGQALAARYDYDPFGNTLATGGSLVQANVYRFSSKERHGSGMYYYGARFYDPNLQRWLNPDPIGERGGINLYSYVHGNPVNLIDPHGDIVPLIVAAAIIYFGYTAIANAPGPNDGTVPPYHDSPHPLAVGASVVAPGATLLWTGVEVGDSFFPPPSTNLIIGVVPCISTKGIRPSTLTPPGAGRTGALREALRRNGVPTSQQPSRVLPNLDKRGVRQPGRVYEYDVPGPGGGTRTVRIRDDAAGHNYGPGDPQNRGPHFNDEAGNHYDYR